MTVIWLIFTTVIGWAVGNYGFEVPHPIIGAVFGFIVGLIVRSGTCPDFDFDFDLSD
jgi:multisubunit Na+/H+ antiporter MnhE subunit